MSKPKQISDRDLLSEASLNWALAHIQQFGDTDLLPRPPEFEAISARWEEVRRRVCDMDLRVYQPSPLRPFLVPKPGNGFRVSKQLDPLDSLVLTAASHEAAAAIEAFRVPVAAGVACSYRLSPDASGNLFSANDGWNLFHATCKALAQDGTQGFVAIADIADFYNQVYLHRVQNALESATVSNVRSESLERILIEMSGQQSQGLPVGPTSSIVFSELLLGDVDAFLMKQGYRHVRYVDDFRIFCASRRDAVRALHDLTEYLHTAHRLSLQSAKSRVVSVREFRRIELRDPTETEAKASEALSNLATHHGGYGELRSVPRATVTAPDQATLKSLFETAVAGKVLDLAVCRHVLRRAGEHRLRVLYPAVLANLDRLAPAFRDVALYIHRTSPEKSTELVGAKLLDLAENGDWGSLPFVQEWVLWLFQVHPGLVDRHAAFELAGRARAELGVRPAAHLALVHGDVEWVRSHRETWKNNGPWDRRAILSAVAVLPLRERLAWLNQVLIEGDPIDFAVAAQARGGHSAKRS